MARLRYNGLSAALGGALTAGGTAITFAAALTHSGGTQVPTIAGTDFIPLSIIDQATGRLSEIVYLTAYTAGQTTGTITRAQEGTAGVAHAIGDKLVHSATVADLTTSSGDNIFVHDFRHGGAVRSSLEENITGTWVGNANQFENTSHTQNDAYAINAWLGPGTYSLEVVGTGNTNRAIQTWAVEQDDGSWVNAAGGLDFYGADQSQRMLRTTFTIPAGQATKRRRVRVKAETRNASGNDWYLNLQFVRIVRTA
jgi:hypothetical protein